MSEEMIDIVVFENENGEEIEFELLFSFEHKEREFGVLRELSEDSEVEDVYLMEIIRNDNDEEEFIEVPEEMMDELSEVVEEIFEEAMEDEFEEEDED